MESSPPTSLVPFAVPSIVSGGRTVVGQEQRELEITEFSLCCSTGGRYSCLWNGRGGGTLESENSDNFF